MRVIARIPDVGLESTAAAPRAVAEPIRAVPDARPRAPGAVIAGPAVGIAKADPVPALLAAAWRAWPVAALAVIAALTWTIASRNEHARLLRQRSEVRMACERAVMPAGSVSGSDGGAVVR